MSKERRKKSKSKPKAAPKINYQGKLSIIVPCYNEEKRVALLGKAIQDFDNRWPGKYELIVVDDGSSDGTVRKLKSIFEVQPPKMDRFEIVELGQNRGKGYALKAGVAAAEGDHILTMDVDIATSPIELLNWARNIPDRTFPENEILIASREHKDSKIQSVQSRKIIGMIFNLIIQLFTSLRLRDTQCGFKLYPAKIAKQLFGNLKIGGWAHDVEVLYKADLQGINIQSLPVKWKHVDGTKINVAKDSFRMFIQTILISILVKWDYFFGQTFSALKAKSPISGEHPVYRTLFVLLSIILLVLMTSVSSDFGITGDEHVQRVYGDKLLKYHKSGGTMDNYLEWKNLKYYGGFFDFLTSWLNPAENPVPPDHPKVGWEEKEFAEPVRRFGDVYDFRHFMNSIFGFFVILFAGLLARTVTGSWKLALLTSLFVALSPRIFGHSMNNPKDIPFAAAYVFTMLHLVKFIKQLPRPGIKSILLIIIGIALSINIRIGGVLLIAYLGLFTALKFLCFSELRKRLLDFKLILGLAVIVLAMSILGYFGGMIFWPYARLDPINNPLEALGQMSNFSTGIRMLFAGEHIWSDKVPWNYIPVWFLITAPLFIIIGLIASPIFMYLRRKEVDLFSLGLIGFAGLFPILYTIINKSPLYDGMRHFMFVYPLMALLAAWAWYEGINLAAKGIIRWGVAAVLAVLMALPLMWMIRNHPYQYIYFNELSGGIENVHARFETDYWMNSMKGLSDWFEENIPEVQAAAQAMKEGKTDEEVAAMPSVRIGTNCYNPVHHYLGKKYPNVKVVYVKYANRETQEWDYGMFYSRFLNRKYLLNDLWPPYEVVYAEKIGNVPLGVICKRGEAYDYIAKKAMDAKDWSTAAENYALEHQQHPNNEAALFGLANAHLQLGNMTESKEALDKLMQMSDEDVTSLGILGAWHLRNQDIGNAKRVYQKAVDINYKYTFGHQQLANFALQEQNYDKAMEHIKLYDENGGRATSVHEAGIQVANLQNNKALAEYFRAKKEYLAGNGQEAYSAIQNSISLDPDYKPAKNLMKVFEELIAKQNQQD